MSAQRVKIKNVGRKRVSYMGCAGRKDVKEVGCGGPEMGIPLISQPFRL
jgi:hypothetical protein